MINLINHELKIDFVKSFVIINNNMNKINFIPKLPHCAQSPDLDGVIEVVCSISKKTETEIRDMINSQEITLTAKIIKDIFKELDLEGKWSYNTSCFRKNKEEMQKGLLDILTGEYSPSVVIRGDIFEKLVKERMDAEKKIK